MLCLIRYFMGAITFCPKFPHNIKSISKYPILNETLYQNSWASKIIDYCVYPAGIILDEDDVHAYISFGHQDRDAYVMKIHIDNLLAGLYHVSDCE